MPYPITQQMRAERRAKAEARQVEYNKLSLDEKISRQEQFKGKEYHRLVKLRDMPKPVIVEAPSAEQPKRLTAEQKAARKAEHKAQVKQVK
jgi:hypothetical protein